MLSLICLLVIASSCLINIYAHWIEDGLIGRIIYMGVFFTCSAALIHLYQEGSVPQFIWATLLVMVTMLFVRSVGVKSVRYLKYWRRIHVKNDQR